MDYRAIGKHSKQRSQQKSKFPWLTQNTNVSTLLVNLFFSSGAKQTDPKIC